MIKTSLAIGLAASLLLPTGTIWAQPHDMRDFQPGAYCLGNDVPGAISQAVDQTLADIPTATVASFVDSFGDYDWTDTVVHADGQILMIEGQYTSDEYGGLVERFFYRDGNLLCGESRLLERIVPPEGGPARAVVTSLWIAADESFHAERNGQPLGDSGLAYADETWASADDHYHRFALAVIAPSADSRYMPLDCKDMIEAFEANMGGVFDCGTMAGYEVHLIEDDLRQALELTRGGRTHTLWVDTPGFNRLGPMLEWRGEMNESGVFVPESLIVRVFIGHDDGLETQRLAVGRLTDDRACFDGWVDVAGNLDHNEDARLLADSPPLYVAPCDDGFVEQDISK